MPFNIKSTFALLLGLLVVNALFSQQATHKSVNANRAELWLTDPGDSVLFKRMLIGTIPGSQSQQQTITVNKAKTYQTMDGFGYALTGGSAMLIHKMSTPARTKLLEELFSTKGSSIGVSYLRISVGSSDLDDHVFSYDDLPAGQTDPQLKKFSLKNDEGHLIPVLKQILAINPKIKILASPWSPPAWMKTNGETYGGNLKPEYYQTYAQYFVKYIRGMKSHGISIDALTIQNEPLNPKNNPSMVMEAPEQADFIIKALGPSLKKAMLKTKIVLYDHNADRPDYPISILDDKEAAKYIDGSAFHLYGGKIDTLTSVHNAHPDKNLYFTEQWVGAPGNLKNELKFHIKELIIGAPRNWCRNVLEWNLAANQNQEPHTPGGCDRCLGAITVNGDKVTRNPAYYIIAHASKFVRPGSKRVRSNLLPQLPNVAFLNPKGETVVIVYNNGEAKENFNIKSGLKTVSSSLNAGAVGTYVLK